MPKQPYNKRFTLHQNKLWPLEESIFDISPLFVKSSLTLAFKFTALCSLYQSVCQKHNQLKVLVQHIADHDMYGFNGPLSHPCVCVMLFTQDQISGPWV